MDVEDGAEHRARRSSAIGTIGEVSGAAARAASKRRRGTMRAPPCQ
ncbi:hypothetical protein [Burkholderia sp. Bp9012]|nr:hypothetical protein [Burkholderia sp. Bp9012]